MSVSYSEAVSSLQDAGPGGICDDCGHFACRHHDMQCHFPRDEPCGCKGMLWLGHRMIMDCRAGPQPLDYDDFFNEQAWAEIEAYERDRAAGKTIEPPDPT